MSRNPSDLSVADLARRAAANLDHIADAATGDQPAAVHLKTPLRLADQIDYDMLHVIEWVERRRNADTAALLRTRTDEIIRPLVERPHQAPPSALFGKGRQLAYSLQRWADDIEGEDQQRQQAGKQERRQGRPRRGRRPEYDPHDDRRLVEHWKAAKRAGANRETFCRGRGITVQALIEAQNREKYRRRRDAE